MYKIEVLFVLFMIYSFIGWIVETILVSAQTKKIVNRGFLIGPYLPIYGTGGVLLTIALDKVKEDLVLVFILSFLICTILEYVTSYIMEKLLKARWWDYSTKSLNINGRVCIQSSLLFGVAGIICLVIVNPFLLHYVHALSNTSLHIICICLVIPFIVDICISYMIVKDFRKTVIDSTLDYTEVLSEKVKNVILERIKQKHEDIKDKYEQITIDLKQKYQERPILYRRLINAFPNLKIIKIELNKKRKNKIKRDKV